VGVGSEIGVEIDGEIGGMGQIGFVVVVVVVVEVYRSKSGVISRNGKG
jgi:hypothetical protein